MSDHDAIDSGRLIQAAETQAVFREVNERIDELNRGVLGRQPISEEWVCECEDGSCIERIEMSQSEYEWLRADGNRFAVLPGHEVQAVEEVIRRCERFFVVAKLGAGGVRAVELTPKR
jgi:hypothetical protein